MVPSVAGIDPRRAELGRERAVTAEAGPAQVTPYQEQGVASV